MCEIKLTICRFKYANLILYHRIKTSQCVIIINLQLQRIIK